MNRDFTREGTLLGANIAACFLLIVPFIVFMYPAIALFTAKSSVAIYFNRYSQALALVNLLNAVIYVVIVYGVIRCRFATLLAATLLLVAVSFVALSSNALLGLPAIAAAAQVTRLSAGLSLILLSYICDREGRRLLARICLVFGALVGLTGFVDLSWTAISTVFQSEKASQLHGQYRTAYNLDAVGDLDVVLVGDSFVWGAGVSVEHRFGDVMERRLQNTGPPRRVYSLGVVGANLQGYIRQIQDLPAGRRAGHVIVTFYANDMPPRSNLQEALEQAATSLARGSITMRYVADIVRVAVTPNVEQYADLVLSYFDERDRTFAHRWQQLDSELRELFRLAQQRSQQAPSLVLLPMLTRFDNSTFDEPLQRVGRLAAQVGFRVIDTMPAFRADGRDATAYRAAPNDLHFNERGNKVVGDVLLRLIGNRLASGEQVRAAPSQ